MNKHKLPIGKYLMLLALDLVACVLAYFLSWVLTNTSEVSFANLLNVWYLILINYILSVCVLALARQYSALLTTYGMISLLKCFIAFVVVLIINIVIALVHPFISFKFAILFTAMYFIFVVIIRCAKRGIIEIRRIIQKKLNKDGERVLIVGGGDAAIMLIRELHSSELIKKYVVGCLDDDESKYHKEIEGVKIYGSINEVDKWVEKLNVDLIIVAMPSLDKQKLKDIYQLCQKTDKKVQTLPAMYQLVEGRASFSQVKDIDMQDLLGRDPIKVNLEEIMGYIEHKVVLVTGGGGSIGSELCRQIVTHNPKQLIILDIYENNLYDIEQELKRNYPHANILALVGSIRGSKKIEDVFKKYRPNLVFNAAAHKHVPLMETSPNEAIKNNVFGALHVAQMADKYNADKFVQISTDKAVNPTNIMGASKRMCEMIIQAIGRKSKHCEFVAVRFGNVLGSNGSVVPLFKKQILAGGPVTLTHKDIIRYFMTIPEAVSLVLQAGAYAKSGEIYVLDMGEPVKIYDLAVNLIRLMGYEPEKDIKIVCTGLRPGEKLYEERLMAEEGLKKTANGLISVAKPIEFDEEKFFNSLPKLYDYAYKETDEMKYLVKEFVPTYTIDERK